ncbi:MAG: pyridoxamine 5'-phosphate oxidase family protein [Deltaproteobacteria bacterium]|nr:pyridoxamine 5'-phosphate oxidase family protein [Deltaproteobacteria bacterium]
MNKNELIGFVNANPVCYLATTEGHVPHVRAVSVYKADESGLFFQISTIKGMYNELTHNPRVELCFNGSGQQVRVSGTAEFIEDQGLKEDVLEARPFLKRLVDAQGYGAIQVFRVANPVATVWTMATNFEPREFFAL